MIDTPAPEPYIEPWMRGTHADVPAVGRAVLHALDLALDDLKKWTDELTDAEIQCHPFGLMPVARHLRHIARSADRLLSYAEGKQLSEEQLKALKTEPQGEETLSTLLAEVEASFRNAAERIRVIASSDLEAHRGIGRKQLPASAGGALIHVADHTQRHVGQVVTTAKLLRALRGTAA
ncbi:MAG TPA: DinB family protein [Terracidiphilus sp.]|nr:DinB family protein [Terracidiphilus sp.]